MSNEVTRVVLQSPDISCAGCTNSIKLELEDLDGVTSVEGDPAKKLVAVAFRAPATLEAIRAAMDDIGFSVDSVIQERATDE